MKTANCRVMLVGSLAPGALEVSYLSAFQDIGCETLAFDLVSAINKYCRLGKPGRLFNAFVPVEPWIRKANRDMVLAARQFAPDVLIVFGQNRVGVGALAQIRAMRQIRLVYVWPDTLVNFNASLAPSLSLYDLVGTYSASTIHAFEHLGARCVAWIPLGADPHMHPVTGVVAGFESDVAFVGQWRPERDAAVSAILSALPNINLKIWGPEWGRRSRDPLILKAWQKRPLYARDFSSAVGSAKINLNIIDDTNYPAANMRFFEILIAGGLQICSPCPEMEAEFRHGETVFYYRNLTELPELIRMLLADENLRQQVAQTAHEKVLQEHMYTHRAGRILELLV